MGAAGITLDDLTPDRIGALTHREASALLVKSAALSLALSTRMATTIPEADAGADGRDRLLEAAEAAELLATTPATLYRNKDRYPFVVRNGRSVRFSANGIAKWIERKRG